MKEATRLTICSRCRCMTRLIDTLAIPVFTLGQGFSQVQRCEICLAPSVQESREALSRAGADDPKPVWALWESYKRDSTDSTYGQHSGFDGMREPSSADALASLVHEDVDRFVKCRGLVLADLNGRLGKFLKAAMAPQLDTIDRNSIHQLVIQTWDMKDMTLGQSNPVMRREQVLDALKTFDLETVLLDRIDTSVNDELLAGRVAFGPLPLQDMSIGLQGAGEPVGYLEELVRHQLATLAFRTLPDYTDADEDQPGYMLALLFLTCALTRERNYGGYHDLLGAAYWRLDEMITVHDGGNQRRLDNKDIRAIVYAMLFESHFDGDNQTRLFLNHMCKAIEWARSDYSKARRFYRAYVQSPERLKTLLQQEATRTREEDGTRSEFYESENASEDCNDILGATAAEDSAPLISAALMAIGCDDAPKYDAQLGAWMKHLMEGGDLTPLWETLSEPALDYEDMSSVVFTARVKGVPGIEAELERVLHGPGARNALKVFMKTLPWYETQALRTALSHCPLNLLRNDDYGIEGLDLLSLRILLVNDSEARRLLDELRSRLRETLESWNRCEAMGADKETIAGSLELADWAQSFLTGADEEDAFLRMGLLVKRIPLNLLAQRWLVEAGLPEFSSGFRSMAKHLRDLGFVCLEEVLSLSSNEAQDRAFRDGSGQKANTVDEEDWQDFCAGVRDLGFSFADQGS